MILSSCQRFTLDVFGQLNRSMAREWTADESSLYKPIDSSSHDIRIITLHPPCTDPNQEKITCSLTRESLHDNPQFEALSYEWGNAGFQKVILINGVQFPARQNLWNALFHLRNKSKDRRLWIDAISIDQANRSERSHQVQQMSQIYRQAWRVLIWLGLESDNSKEALEFLRTRSVASPLQQAQQLGVGLDQFLRKIQALLRLCHRPYWRRMWIIQEIVLAQKALLCCGSDHASWNDFNNFRVLWDKRIAKGFATRYLADPRPSLAFDLDRLRSQSRKPTFEVLLRTFQTSLCLDVRDKVYSLAGLAVEGEGLRIDYSNSAFNIFADMLSIQWKSRSTSLVGFARFLQRVLDIHALGDGVPDGKSLAMDCVEAAGREISRIRLLGPLLADLDSSQHRLELKVPFNENANDSLPWKVGESLSFKAACRIWREVTVIHSPISYGYPHRIKPKSSPTSSYSHIGRRETRSKRRMEDQATYDYINAVPRFFRDNWGNVGLVPSNVRCGDTICFFEDSNVLAVLRWRGDRFSIIGRAVFLELNSGQACFVVPNKRHWGRRIAFRMNAHTVYLLTR